MYIFKTYDTYLYKQKMYILKTYIFHNIRYIFSKYMFICEYKMYLFKT